MQKILIFLMLLTGCLLTAAASGPSGTLPVIHIDIEGNQEVTSKEKYLKAQYWLDPMNAEDMDAIGSEASPLTLQIKGRGNYTFNSFNKKPYRLKLDKKQPLYGLKSSKHFGLLAHADDTRGFLRNTMGFAISKGLGLPWTPEQRPVEVVINGTYRGLYFLVELIRIDKNRVDITEWEDEDADGNALSKWVEGGTLVEIDNYDEEGQVRITDGDGADMRITYDKSVDPGFEPEGYKDWLKGQFAKMNELIFGDKNSDEIWDYIDLDDCARYMLVQDLTNNYESFHGSCYMFRDKGAGEKWHFSPVWDFGSAFFRDRYPDFHFWENSVHHNHWAAQLWRFPRLQEKMKELWIEYENNGFSQLSSIATAFIDNIKEAAACDKERWPEYGNDNLNGSLGYVKSFLRGGANYLNSVFGYDVPLIPADFSVPEDEEGIYHVFFRPTGKAVDWEKVKIFYWDSHFSNCPAWPGISCEYVRVGGENYWYHRLEASEDRDDYMLIFDNGEAGKGENQTYDLMVRKRGVYTLDMADHAIPFEFLPVGSGPGSVADIIDTCKSVEIISLGKGTLTIRVSDPVELPVYSIDGATRLLPLIPGDNRVSLPRGLYIIAGKKLAL